MPESLFKILEQYQVERCFAFNHNQSGLRAFLIIDNLVLGPAAGGIRTLPYASPEEALEDAIKLARAMTIKCALAGLDAGGGKAVVLEHKDLRRKEAFEELGRRVQELGGIFRTAGDLGTTKADLDAMSQTTQFVHANEGDLSAAVAKGLRRSIEACCEVKDRRLPGLAVAVQGCGSIGSAVARELSKAGAHVVVADLDYHRAQTLADEIHVEVAAADSILRLDVDVVAPCASGDVLTRELAGLIKAWAICGAANNVLAEPGVEDLLVDRGVLYVPDVIGSAGAVIEGIGATVMKLADRAELIDQIGVTAKGVLEESLVQGRLPTAVAEERAWRRIGAAQKSFKAN